MTLSACGEPPGGGSVVYYDSDLLKPTICCGDEYPDPNTNCMGCQCKSTPGSPQQDNNACTHDVCKSNGVWFHMPVTDAELDDGDPCTVDTCDPQHGIMHTNTCV